MASSPAAPPGSAALEEYYDAVFESLRSCFLEVAFRARAEQGAEALSGLPGLLSDGAEALLRAGDAGAEAEARARSLVDEAKSLGSRWAETRRAGLWLEHWLQACDDVDRGVEPMAQRLRTCGSFRG